MEIWTKVISQFMLPPAILVVIALAALVASFRWRVYGIATIAICLVLIYFFSIPITSIRLMHGLENTYPAINPLTLQSGKRKQKVIVILGGGRYDNAPEYSPETVNDRTLVRLRFGARLHKATKLPILVTGGLGSDIITPEAVLMQKTLQRDFGVSARWVEDDSANTMENALRTGEILLPKNISEIYLVTHASHMPRAVWAFTQAGFLVTPAPTQFTTISAHSKLRILEYLPSAGALAISSRAIRARIGLFWYQFRYTPVKLAEMSRSPKKQREIADQKAASAAEKFRSNGSQQNRKNTPARRTKSTVPTAPLSAPPPPPLPPG